MNAAATRSAACGGGSSCPSSPLQQKAARLTPPTSGRSTPLPSLTLPPLALPRAAAALAALSLDVPAAAATAAPIEDASRVAAAAVRDPIEAENEALAEFVSWLIANGALVSVVYSCFVRGER